MERQFESPEYRRSRNAYTAQCAFEYFVVILVSDAFLAKLLKQIGLDDASVGIIASFVSFSFLFQLVSILLMQRVKNVKRTALIADTVSQALFLGEHGVFHTGGFGPARPVAGIVHVGVEVLEVQVVVLLGYAFKYAVSSIVFRWANSYVDPKARRTFSAVKEMISLLSGIVFTLAVGFVFDRFEAGGNLRGGFLVLAGTILLLNVCNFTCLCLIAKPEAVGEEHRPLGEVMRSIFGNRAFLHILVLACLWDAARYISVGFLGTYKTEDLALTVGTVQVVNMAANLCRFAVSKPFGRFSDRTSYAHGFRLALLIAAGAFAVGCVTAPATRWFIVLYAVLYNVSLAGSNQNGFNLPHGAGHGDQILGGRDRRLLRVPSRWADPLCGPGGGEPDRGLPGIRAAGPLRTVPASHPHRVPVREIRRGKTAGCPPLSRAISSTEKGGIV